MKSNRSCRCASAVLQVAADRYRQDELVQEAQALESLKKMYERELNRLEVH